MVKQVLTRAGFIEDETFRETKFVSPPKEITYAIYFDSFTRRGADGLNLIKEHSCTIELYAYYPDPEAEARLEASLDKAGVEYEKSDTTWIDTEHLYLTVYNFDYIEK